MMAEAVAARDCDMPADEHRLRIVTFMTDGYVGNDLEVLDLVQKLRGTSRWFPFGTGNGVNRFLIDGMARLGGGEPYYVLLERAGRHGRAHVLRPRRLAGPHRRARRVGGPRRRRRRSPTRWPTCGRSSRS